MDQNYINDLTHRLLLVGAYGGDITSQEVDTVLEASRVIQTLYKRLVDMEVGKPENNQ